MEAPLSSPTLNGSSRTHPSYFNPSTSTTSASSSYRTQSQTGAPSASNTQAQPHQVQAQTQAQTHAQYAPQQSAEPFLRDFNLVAEAAKRAQMAVLMRDLEAVGI
ncbi:uncharacterized protein BP5553_00342 [Venustampulla echinocandica]|uniref:Uncharacterized protein n=1 Tax=Venustampulla echinocandica TaxID=2656787 RepID=A0A370TXW8_9HELO|nr:uncharacterized protein BP5553_00342 [Venustampulla echinocandica]RDL40363.1 hypothetical protein BP5553_00342 [Venustampulla echinocandica]